MGHENVRRQRLGRAQTCQPFFMQIQLPGGKLRGGQDDRAKKLSARAARELGGATDPAAVTLPPYYPRDPVLLRDWAAYLDAVRFTDEHVGKVIARLEQEGLLANSLVIFMTDHGISHARGKQFLYNEGTHIPFVVRGPGIPPGQVRADLIEHIDMAAISLAAAGLPIPKAMQARDVFAKNYELRTPVFAARDRCDETVERLRSVRTDRFLYIRNSIRNARTCSPTPTRTAKPLWKPCIHSTPPASSTPSRKNCCSARRARRRNSMIGLRTRGRCRI